MLKLRVIICIVAAIAVAACGYFIYSTVLNPPVDLIRILDLGYQQDEIHELKFSRVGDRGLPQVPVSVGGGDYDLLFDTGCSSGISFTNVMEDKIEYSLMFQSEEINRDGSHRGWSKHVTLEEFGVFNETYRDIETKISDWSLFSSQPFNGAIGLIYFSNKTVTLDYKNRRIAVGNRPIDYDSLTDNYTVLDLYHSTSRGQENLPFIEAELNGEAIMVYIDTGKSYSNLYDPGSSGSIQDHSQFVDVTINIGGVEFLLRDVAVVNDLAQAEGLPHATMVELNSDQIWKNGLLVTFDLIDNKVIIRKR